MYLAFIRWPTVKGAYTSSHYDTLFIAVHNFVNLTIWDDILQMQFTCFQKKKNPKKKKSVILQHKAHQNPNRCFIKKFYYPFSLEQRFGIQQGAYPTVRDMSFPAKTFSSEIILRNEPLGTLRSHTLHRGFFSTLTALEFPPALSQI